MKRLLAISLITGLIAIAAPAHGASWAAFKDVSQNSPFREEIEWGQYSNIVEGYSDGTFRSDAPTSRYAASEFLWRMYGRHNVPMFAWPQSHARQEPQDIGETTAPRWCFAWGIVGTYSDGTFRGADFATRQAFVTFLWRAAGEPIVEGGSAFSDVTDNPFLTAITWAEQAGITQGYSDGTFRGSQAISRGGAIAMLYRFNTIYEIV